MGSTHQPIDVELTLTVKYITKCHQWDVKVKFHEKPNRRQMFGEHASDGWYIRTSPEHYRCHIVLVRKT
ncbi:hypothetical protein ACHAW6_000970 [Cyclotella cf. meneghiniana]